MTRAGLFWDVLMCGEYRLRNFYMSFALYVLKRLVWALAIQSVISSLFLII
jgi:hypothetical protein